MNRNPIINLFVIISFCMVCQFAVAHEFNQQSVDSIQRLLKSAKKDSTKVNLYLAIAKEYRWQDTSSTLRYARHALGIAEHIKWNQGVSKCNLFLGRFYDHIQEESKAFTYYYRCLNTASIENDSLHLGELYNLMANNYFVQNRIDSALKYFHICLSYRFLPQDRLAILAGIGQAYTKIADFSNALQSYLQALKLNQEILDGEPKGLDDSLMHCGILISIGDVYIEMAAPESAFNNYQKAFQLNKRLNHPTIEILSLNGLGISSLASKKFAEAAQFCENALKVAMMDRDTLNSVNVMADLSKVYLESGDFNRALDYSNRAKSMAESKLDDNLLSKVYTILGLICIRKTDYIEAIRYLQLSIRCGDRSGSNANKRDAWKALGKAYEQMGQHQLSLEAYKNYYAYRDSVYNVEKARQMTSSLLQYDFDVKQFSDSLKTSAIQLNLERQRIYTLGSIAGIALLLVLSFFTYRSYSRTKKMNTEISKANETISAEKQVSENLLLNILPQHVADELKSHGKVKAKRFKHVSVLFTDFVKFTQLAEKLSPEEIVEELDTCFRAFDEITVKYNVEKVKTIGDAYMAISGLPVESPDHAERLVKAAIEMQDFMIARKADEKNHSFEMRIGIHSGDVIAGIVGVKKFAYDIWGDTVNTAARMEQSGVAGKINISESTWRLVKDQFVCTDRGEIDAKNKGKMRMFIVESVIANT